MASDPAAQLIASLSDDPEVRTAAKALALDSIQVLRRSLRRGSPAIQLQTASRMLPAIVKALADTRGDENDEMRKAVEGMNADIQKALGITPHEDAPDAD